MGITLQQIADMAGGSRGEVDRALNDRGRINPEVAERIRKIAEENHYQSNRKKKKTEQQEEIPKIGVVTQLCKSAFMIEVNRGIEKAKSDLEDRGAKLLLRECERVDENEELKAINELVEEGICALAVMPVDSDVIRSRINELTEEKHIPVITFNSDIVGTGRVGFIGLDNEKSGRTAAGLMGMMCRGTGKILIIIGFFANRINGQRVEGFVQEVKKTFPDMELLGVQSSNDDEDEVESIITSTLEKEPDLAGIFLVSSGQTGVRRALEKVKPETRPYIIAYDSTPVNTELLQDNVIDFLIDQEAYAQGNRPPRVLFEIVRKKRRIKNEFMYTQINIKSKYNV